MRIAWTPNALFDLADIEDYLLPRMGSVGAKAHINKIKSSIKTTLGVFPMAGREGEVPGTRELPLPDFNRIAIYRIKRTPSQVEILMIRGMPQQ